MIFIPGLLPLLPGQTFNALNDAPDNPHFRVELRDLHPEGSQGSRFTLSLTDYSHTFSGKAKVFVLVATPDTKLISQRILYQVKITPDERDSLVSRHLIDDNDIAIDSEGNYTVPDQGTAYGYSTKVTSVLIPFDLYEGEYLMQVAA
jgi:hypothetical protein